MKRTFSTADRQQYQEQGFVILRQVFSPGRIQSLVAAIERLIDRALAGQTQTLRIERKTSTENQIEWIGDPKHRIPERLLYLLLGDRYDPAYASWLEEDVLPLLESLLQSPVRYSLFGMLAGGGKKAYLQEWHHDLRSPDGFHPAVIFDPEPFWFVQFNAPLKPHDRFLQIIPASHNRRATPGEIEAYQKNPQGELPGQMTVELEPGDIAFYNFNLWHRGWNPKGESRWTMHAAFWRPDFAVMAHEAGQRETILTPGHLDQLPPRTRSFMQRYVDAYPSEKPPTLAEVMYGTPNSHHRASQG